MQQLDVPIMFRGAPKPGGWSISLDMYLYLPRQYELLQMAAFVETANSLNMEILTYVEDGDTYIVRVEGSLLELKEFRDIMWSRHLVDVTIEGDCKVDY